MVTFRPTRHHWIWSKALNGSDVDLAWKYIYDWHWLASLTKRDHQPYDPVPLIVDEARYICWDCYSDHIKQMEALLRGAA
jgi:hypothetical protein